MEKEKLEINNPRTKERSALGKFWNWLWHSNSFLSWLVALLIAFIIVKFMFFPFMKLVTGTSLPIVVVESSSMEHPGSVWRSVTGFAITSQDKLPSWWEKNGAWYDNRDITQEEFSTFSFNNGFDKGDIIFAVRATNPKVGDIIIFNANTAHPIIHRIVAIDEKNGKIYYSTKGDNNIDQLPSGIESEIPEDAIIGRAVFRIPKLGWIKLIFVELGKLFN